MPQDWQWLSVCSVTGTCQSETALRASLPLHVCSSHAVQLPAWAVQGADMMSPGYLPEKTNQMGGACPTLACSHLASLLQMVPLKPSLPTSSARWLASLYAQ